MHLYLLPELFQREFHLLSLFQRRYRRRSNKKEKILFMRLLQKFCKLPPAKEPSSNLLKLTQYVVENVTGLRTLKNFSSWDSELRGLPFKMIPCPEKRSVNIMQVK